MFRSGTYEHRSAGAKDQHRRKISIMHDGQQNEIGIPTEACRGKNHLAVWVPKDRREFRVREWGSNEAWTLCVSPTKVDTMGHFADLVAKIESGLECSCCGCHGPGR